MKIRTSILLMLLIFSFFPVTGDEEKINSLFSLLRGFGVKEMARSLGQGTELVGPGPGHAPDVQG